jgi:hypothetical protein
MWLALRIYMTSDAIHTRCTVKPCIRLLACIGHVCLAIRMRANMALLPSETLLDLLPPCHLSPFFAAVSLSPVVSRKLKQAREEREATKQA